MKAVTMIYMAVALSTSLSIGVLGAFFWSERRCRERERWLRDRCMHSLDTADVPSAPADESQERLIPIHRRPFHEALWEDEPDLAPSPQLRAFLERQALRRELEPTSTDAVPVLPMSTAPLASSQKSIADVPPSTHEVASAHEENDEMLKQQMAVAALATVALLSACQAPLAKPEYRRNPYPRERYEITMTIHDAPGPLTDIVGAMQYLVPDESCVPETGGPMNPLRLNPKNWIRYPVEQIAENTYRAVAWADGMVDEDYYGLGVCKWRLVQTNLSLKGKSVRFNPSLSLEELRAQRPKTLYFSDRMYLATDMEGWPDIGYDSPTYFGAEVQDELFTITLTPRRIAP